LQITENSQIIIKYFADSEAFQLSGGQFKCNNIKYLKIIIIKIVKININFLGNFLVLQFKLNNLNQRIVMSHLKIEEQIGGTILHLKGQFIGGNETEELRIL